jgi:hypothetical protein
MQNSHMQGHLPHKAFSVGHCQPPWFPTNLSGSGFPISRSVRPLTVGLLTTDVIRFQEEAGTENKPIWSNMVHAGGSIHFPFLGSVAYYLPTGVQVQAKQKSQR